MNQTEPFKEESDPKEDLKGFVIVTALVGIIALVLWGLYYLFYYLVTSTGNPLAALFSTIGNILENTIGKVPMIVQFAIIFFMIAGILGFGLLLKDEDDIKRYRSLVTIIWSIALIVLFALLGIALSVSVPLSLAIGLGFIFFIAPPFVFAAYKDLSLLYKKIKQ